MVSNIVWASLSFIFNKLIKDSVGSPRNGKYYAQIDSSKTTCFECKTT